MAFWYACGGSGGGGGGLTQAQIICLIKNELNNLDFVEHEVNPPANGQTVFILPSEPLDPDQIDFIINTDSYNGDFGAGNYWTFTAPMTITWNFTAVQFAYGGFDISSTDQIVIKYLAKVDTTGCP